MNGSYDWRYSFVAGDSKPGLAWNPMMTAVLPAARASANVSRSHAAAASVRRVDASSSAAVRAVNGSRAFQLPGRFTVTNISPLCVQRACSANSANGSRPAWVAS